MFVCYYRYICIFIYTLQGSVETHLQCCRMRIANCPQSVLVKKCGKKKSITGESIDKSKLPRFLLAHPVYGKNQ